jgi:thermitase
MKQTPGTARLESLAFQVEPSRGGSPETTARSALRRAFPGERWSLLPLNPREGEFEAVPIPRGRPPARRQRKRRPSPAPISVAAAWELAYRLREPAPVVYAEPLFEIVDEQQLPDTGLGRRSRSTGTGPHDPGTEECDWNLETLHVREAWKLFERRKPGAGIVIGHPDTGYTDHPEIAGVRLRVSQGYDFEGEDEDARDPLESGPLRHAGHGTGTASLIISGEGPARDWSEPEFVSGLAPAASLIPIRTTRSVVLWSMSRLTRAIRYAAAQGAHVVSISLGGPVRSQALHNAVRDAELEGLIVLAAAGNNVRFVVCPANFDEVIAVAASRIDDTEWPGSCRGPAVDITAPGSSIWRAVPARTGTVVTYDVERGSGTSYAVAQTAGLAALWLSYHGRGNLISRYGRHRLAAVFKEALQRSCRTPPHWNTDDFGPGIAEANTLLRAPLPDAAPARALRHRSAAADAPLDWLLDQLAPAPRSGAMRVLAAVLRVSETALPGTLEEVGAELAMQVGLDPELRTRLRESASRAAKAWRSNETRVALGAVRRRLARRPASRRLRRLLRGS